MKFGDSLKRFRDAFGLSQAQIARDIGIQSPQYRRYEWGQATPSVDFIYKMTNKYDVSADYLLGLSDEPRPPKIDEKTLALIRALQDWRGSEQVPAQ